MMEERQLSQESLAMDLPAATMSSARRGDIGDRHRASQRRYRLKQKDKLKEAEGKVAQLTAELEAAKMQQEHLSRELQRNPSRDDHLDGPRVDLDDTWWMNERGRRLLMEGVFTCTISEEPFTVPVRELEKMTVEHVIGLARQYQGAFATCLLDVQQEHSDASNLRLNQVVDEALMLWDYIRTKPPDFIGNGVAKMLEKLPNKGKHTEAAYRSAVQEARLGEQQVQLMLQVRTAFLTNSGRLHHVREGLLAENAAGTLTYERGMAVKLDSTAAACRGLRTLLQQEHRQFLELQEVTWRHIFTPPQTALISVMLAPYCEVAEIMEAIAATVPGALSRQQLLVAAVGNTSLEDMSCPVTMLPLAPDLIPPDPESPSKQ